MEGSQQHLLHPESEAAADSSGLPVHLSESAMPARSSARHDKRDWSKEGERLLHGAITHTAMVREFQKSLTADFHAFELEAIHADPVAFVDQISRVLESLPVQREELLQFVHRDGGYH
jgi:hypothetical protein